MNHEGEWITTIGPASANKHGVVYFLIHYLGTTGGQRPFYSCIKMWLSKGEAEYSSGWIFSDHIENYGKYEPTEDDIKKALKAVFT